MEFAYIQYKRSNSSQIFISLFDCFIPSDIKEIKEDSLIIPFTSTQYDIYQSSKNKTAPEIKKFISKIPKEIVSILDTISVSANPTICIVQVKAKN